MGQQPIQDRRWGSCAKRTDSIGRNGAGHSAEERTVSGKVTFPEGEEQGSDPAASLLFLWGRERAQGTGYLLGGLQSIPHWPVKTTFLGEIGTGGGCS